MSSWKRENPDRVARHRLTERMRRHGLTADDYDSMLAAQGGVCALCPSDNGARPLYVDHDHETGAVRGLLCHTCNSNLGGYEAMKRNEERVLSYLTVA